MSDKIRVLIADDHAVVRQGLRAFLEVQDDIDVVGEASDGGEAVKLTGAISPDVVVMDLVMPRVDGVEAIRTVNRGQALLNPPVAAKLMQEFAHESRPAASRSLTDREMDVLRLIARGRSNKEIALDLGVAEKTVKTHVSNILGKLQLADRTQAALYAVRERLVEIE